MKCGNAFVEKSPRDQAGGKDSMGERVMMQQWGENILGTLGC